MQLNSDLLTMTLALHGFGISGNAPGQGTDYTAF